MLIYISIKALLKICSIELPDIKFIDALLVLTLK